MVRLCDPMRYSKDLKWEVMALWMANGERSPEGCSQSNKYNYTYRVTH